MGFVDPLQNLRVLLSVDGNLGMAVDYLLNAENAGGQTR